MATLILLAAISQCSGGSCSASQTAYYGDLRRPTATYYAIQRPTIRRWSDGIPDYLEGSTVQMGPSSDNRRILGVNPGQTMDSPNGLASVQPKPPKIDPGLALVVLTKSHGLTIAEAAHALGISEAVAKNTIAGLEKQVAEQLADSIPEVGGGNNRITMPTAPGSPGAEKFGPRVRVEAPPAPSYCPSCGHAWKSGASGCTDCPFTFTGHFERTEAQWQSMLRHCPSCGGNLNLVPGMASCSKCRFRMATDLKDKGY